MNIELYELKTNTPLEEIKAAALTLETINSEIQILNIRNSQGELKGREIDASRIGIHITDK